MENIIRKISLIFILCMLVIILLFIGINNQNKNNSNKEEKVKKEEKVSKKDKVEKKEDKEETKEDNSNVEENKVEENNQKEENNVNYNYNTNNTVESNYNSIPSNQVTNTTIPVSKFGSRINNNRLHIGEKAQITTTIYPENATVKDTYYTSSDNNVAIVSQNGEVTAIGVGTCYITISVKDVASSGQLKVVVLAEDNTTYSDNN